LLVAGRKEIYEIEKKCRNVKRLAVKFVTGNIEWNKIKKHLSGKKKSDSKRLIYGENISGFVLNNQKIALKQHTLTAMLMSQRFIS
jgi:hypothetical protein